MEFQGSKFIPGRPMKDISAAIRAELKTLPIKAKVKIHGNRIINIVVSAADIQTHVVESWRGKVVSPAGKALIAQIRAIAREYNREDIDTSSDLFNVEFYTYVSIDEDCKLISRPLDL